MKKMKGKEKSASRVEENITAHLRQASPNPRVPALTRTLHLQDRNDEMVSWDGNGEVGVDRGAAAACHRLALSNVFACAEGSLEFEAGPPGSKTRRGARGMSCPSRSRCAGMLRLDRGDEASGRRDANVCETSWTIGGSCACGTKGVAGEVRADVTSSEEESESSVLILGGRCGSDELGEMGAIGGASSDAGRGKASPGDDKGNSGATGSESSVEISSRGEDERVDDERRGASVSSGGSDSVRGDRPNFETGLSDVDAGSDSGSGCSSVTDVTGDGRNVDESGDKGWSVERGNDNKGADIDVGAASCSDSG
ncbi:hypothetical protein EDB84DRAFT_1672629 [Lactarius hengduanensis]|nr:hypothetical protein EDB84DRAFT_1672629 [Lactarius hengduanensis]